MIKISDLFKSSDEYASILPEIIFESSILSRNIIEGLHASRISGKGEDFWQFKEYRQGDSLSSIDWRKSAALNKVLVKQKENETAKTIYFYFDKTKSMFFKSKKNLQSKYEIAVLLLLTLSRLFLKNRENVFHFKTNKSMIKCSNDLSSFTESFLFEEKDINYPEQSLVANNSICFIISDFLYDIKTVNNFLINLKQKNVSGFLIQILDPLEIDFNIKENLILNDLETNAKLRVNESNKFKNFYDKKLKGLQYNLKDLCKGSNWSYVSHDTSKNIKPVLIEICKSITIKEK
tara:strand:+ start:1006 stop:1878 length:873 start_codon:yes stop_codon:yes gene_type:complete